MLDVLRLLPVTFGSFNALMTSAAAEGTTTDTLERKAQPGEIAVTEANGGSGWWPHLEGKERRIHQR